MLAHIETESKVLPRAARRASILRGAAQAFATSGYAATSMEDVAQACGVTKLIVYRHFDSKEELYREVIQQVFHRLGEELRRALPAPRNSGLGPRTLLTVAREDPAAFTLLWRHAAREPQFATYAAELRTTSVAIVSQLAAVASEDATMDRWRADALFGWLIEATLNWLDDGDPNRDEEFMATVSAGFRALRQAITPP